MNKKAANLTARSKQNNITVSGLLGDTKEENCKQTFFKFVRDVMDIPIEFNEILHRVGRPANNVSKLMVIRCQPDLKEQILQNVRNLRGVKNDQGQFYYVNKQLPEAFMERNCEIRQTIKDIKRKEEHLPVREHTKIEVHSGALYLNNEKVKKKIQHPTTQRLFPSKQDKALIAKAQFYNSDTIGEQDSNIVAMATKVHNLQRKT